MPSFTSLRIFLCNRSKALTKSPKVFGISSSSSSCSSSSSPVFFSASSVRILTYLSIKCTIGSSSPPVMTKSLLKFFNGNVRKSAPARLCEVTVFPKLPLPNTYPYVPYHVFPLLAGFNNRYSTPYFCETSSTETSLALNV